MKETSDIAPVKAYLDATRDSCGFRAFREQFRPPINVRSTTTDARHETTVYEGYSSHAKQNGTNSYAIHRTTHCAFPWLPFKMKYIKTLPGGIQILLS